MAKSKLLYAFERYRGVFFLVSIPIGLLLVILLLLPNSQPSQQAVIAGHDSVRTRYAIVLDAGSTGSRVHVFKFEQTSSELKLISDTFEQLKPGLSSFADKPQEAANSLKPLMETALRTVPKDLQAETPVSLKATAGLRLLPGDKADKILEAVTAFLETYPFTMADDAVAILGGQDEGGFAWLTLNYLLGKLGGGPQDTVAAIDLGGGSVQEAFAVSDGEASAAPKGYVMKLKGGGQLYNVYVHSYLGYGLMAGRAKVIDTIKDKAHPCFFDGFKGTYKYAGHDYPVTAAGKPQFGQCAAAGLTSMNVKAACGTFTQDQCSFSGAWRGKAPLRPRTYYVSSYFWDRAQESGIITDPKAISWPTTVEEFMNKALKACSSDLASITAEHGSVKPDAAPYFCLDLTYCHSLLVHGFKLPNKAAVTLVKQVQYNGQSIEAAWPLGAAINDLSA